MDLKDSYDIYTSLGFVLNTTKPKQKRSSLQGKYIDRKQSRFMPKATGYAAIIPKTIIIVDNDSYEDDNNFEEFVKELGYMPTPFALTPSGGEHYAFDNAMPDYVIGDTSRFRKVDIFAGYQSVIPIVGTTVTNKMGVDAQYEWVDPEVKFYINPWTDELKDIFALRLRGERKVKKAAKEGEINTDAFERNTELPDETVDAILDALPKDLDYPDWFNIGQCLFDRYDGSDEGREKWEKFTRASTKSNPNKSTALDKWDGGAISPTDITWRSLPFLADNHALSGYQQMMTHAKTEGEFESIKDKIRGHGWFVNADSKAQERTEQLADDWRKARKSAGVDSRLMQKQAAIEALDVIAEQVAEHHGTMTIPWLDDIVLDETVVGSHKYYHLTKKVHFSAEGILGTYKPELLKLRKQLTKGKGALNFPTLASGLIKVCSKSQFNPLRTERVYVDQNGANVLNLYLGRPKPADRFTPKGEELIKHFVDHIHMLMDTEEANTFLQMIGWLAQNFGQKLLWAPLIQSVEGAGKSVIGDILINHVFGSANSGTVDPDALLSENNTWAVDGVFKVLEEVRISGHNRHEILNKLKPVVTNSMITHIEKYRVSQTVPNHTNLVAFTNFKDAIPANSGDRRWWIIYSRLQNKEQITEQTGLSLNDYFSPLYELKEAKSPYGAELLKYLLELDVSGFIPKFLPESKHKDYAIASEDTNTEYLLEVKDAFLANYKGVTEDVLSTRQLTEVLVNQYEADSVKPQHLAILVKKLGFVKLPSLVTYHGKKHSLWFSDTNKRISEIKKLFLASMEEGIAPTQMGSIEEKEEGVQDEYSY